MRFIFDLRASDEPSMRWAKTAQSITIGRHPECDLVLVSELVSGKHAAIEESGSAAVVRDLGSTNGTYLNGNRVDAPSPLHVGDTVAFGQGGTTLTVFALEPSAGFPRLCNFAPTRPSSPPAPCGWGEPRITTLFSTIPRSRRITPEFSWTAGARELSKISTRRMGLLSGTPPTKRERAEFGRGDSIYFGAIPVACATFLPGPPPPSPPKAGQEDRPDRSLC